MPDVADAETIALTPDSPIEPSLMYQIAAREPVVAIAPLAFAWTVEPDRCESKTNNP